MRFQDWAAAEEMSANEVILFLAIARCINDRWWPDGPVGLTNNQILVYTTFHGSQRDRTLRETRKKLAERGIIRFSPGEKCRAGQEAQKAVYQLCLEPILKDSAMRDPEAMHAAGNSPEEPEEDQQEGEDSTRGMTETAAGSTTDSTVGSMAGSMAGSMVGSTVGSMAKKYHARAHGGGCNILQNPKSKSKTENSSISYLSVINSTARARGVEPRMTGESRIHGGRTCTWFDPAHPDRDYDDGWIHSGRVRKSIALAMLQQVEADGMDMMPKRWDHGFEGNDMLQVLQIAMAAGMNPRRIMRAAELADGIDDWSMEVKRICLNEYGTDNFPPEWEEVNTL